MSIPLPIAFADGDWYSTFFISERLGIPLRTIQHWCKTGFFIKRGCRVILSSRRRSPHWINIPIQSKDAILKQVTLDIDKPKVYPPLDDVSDDEGALSGSGTTALC